MTGVLVWTSRVPRLVRFGLVGGFCSGVLLAPLHTLVTLGVQENLANFLAFSICIQLNFILSYFITWGDKRGANPSFGKSTRLLVSFNGAAVLAMIVNQGCFTLLLRFTHHLAAGLFGILIGAIVTYFVANTVVFSHEPRRWIVLLHLFRAMRPKQWAKNVFVLAAVPFLLADFSWEGVVKLVVVFAAFCLAASSVYLANDIWDAEKDRGHPEKCFRPIASGELPIPIAIASLVALVIASLGVSAFAGIQTLVLVLAYLGISNLYTFRFKHLPVWDVLFVGSLYSIRVLAGFSAVSIFPKSWIVWVILAGFVALAVEIGKRQSEVQALGSSQTRRTLSFYSDARLRVMFLVASLATVAVFLVAALSVSPFLAFSTLLVAGGLIRFWALIKRLTKDVHPQRVIFGDLPMRAILLAFTGLFTAAIALPIS